MGKYIKHQAGEESGLEKFSDSSAKQAHPLPTCRSAGSHGVPPLHALPCLPPEPTILRVWGPWCQLSSESRKGEKEGAKSFSAQNPGQTLIRFRWPESQGAQPLQPVLTELESPARLQASVQSRWVCTPLQVAEPRSLCKGRLAIKAPKVSCAGNAPHPAAQPSTVCPVLSQPVCHSNLPTSQGDKAGRDGHSHSIGKGTEALRRLAMMHGES